MKKILSLFLCLLLLAALATPVFAAQAAQMTVTASKTNLKPGDKVTFTVSVNKVENCTVGGFMFDYDKNVFTYKSGKSLAGLKGFMAGVSTAANKLAGFFMNGKETIEGELFSVTMIVREDAAPGTYTVTGRPNLNTGKIECSVNGAQVTVSAGTSAETDNVKTTLPSIPVPSKPVVDTLPVVTDPVADNSPEESKTPATGETPVPEGQKVTLPPAQVLDEGEPEKPAFPWWIVAVIAVVAAGGAVFLIIESRKTKNTP